MSQAITDAIPQCGQDGGVEADGPQSPAAPSTANDVSATESPEVAELRYLKMLLTDQREAGTDEATRRSDGVVLDMAIGAIQKLQSRASTANEGEAMAKMRAALQDIADAEAIPNDAVAFVWCREVARAALTKRTEHE